MRYVNNILSSKYFVDSGVPARLGPFRTMVTPSNSLPVALPAQPNDPNVPPNINDLGAVKYRQTVDVSIGMQITYDIPCNFLIVSPAERSPAVRCTPNNRYNTVLYEHGVVAQAAAAVGPQSTTALRKFYLPVDLVCSCSPPLVPRCNSATSH
jgi:hypothetical protein